MMKSGKLKRKTIWNHKSEGTLKSIFRGAVYSKLPIKTERKKQKPNFFFFAKSIYYGIVTNE